MKEQTLTLKEAIKQGYTHCCYGHPSNGYQPLDELTNVTEQDVLENEIYLAGKHTFQPAGLTNRQIKVLLAEQIWINHEDKTGDDTDTIYEAIKDIDFQDVSDRIEEALKKYNTFRYITEIKLVPAN